MSYKKFLSILLTLVLCVGLIGCGSSSDSDDSSSDGEMTVSEDGVASSEDENSSSGDGSSKNSEKTEKDNSTDEAGTAEIVNLTLEDFLSGSEMFKEKEKEIGYDENYTSLIQFSGSQITCEDSQVTIETGETNRVILSSEGIYRLKGTAENAQVVVNAPNREIRLVFDGLTVSNVSDAVLYVEDAEEVYITLADNTGNELSVNGEFADEETGIDGVIYSKDDLTINGNGKLDVQTKYGHGIVSKDDFKITGGIIMVASSGHSLVGKDSVRICDGEVTLASERDGIHADNEEKAEKGFIYIAGGHFQITAKDDGMDATGHIVLNGGTITIDSEDDAIHGNRSTLVEDGTFSIHAGNDGIHTDGNLTINNGTIQIAESYEGLEGNTILINGGDITVNSSDDGMNAASASSNEEGAVDFGREPNGKDFPNGELPQMPDGEKPDMKDFPNGEPPQMPDGEKPDVKDFPNGELPQMPDGEKPDMKDFPNGEKPNWKNRPDGESQDWKNKKDAERPSREDMPDGERPDWKDGQGGFVGGRFGGFAGFGSDESCDITINGGNLTIIAQGDGIDSNGTLEITGGIICISGPESSMNGALDYGINGTISGGTIIAAGAAGMAESFDKSSTQAFIYKNVNGNANDEVVLSDGEGKELVKYTPVKKFQNLVISCPELRKGETYILKVGAQELTVEPSISGR